MNVVFADDDLDRLETDPTYAMGLPPGVVKAYRKRLQAIRSSIDERDLYAMTSSHFEKLKGKRRHQRSMRLNDQYRLILEIEERSGTRVCIIVAVEDYH